MRYAERFDYDPLRQVLVTRMEFTPVDGSPGWVVLLTQRQFFPQELEALLHYAGFASVDFSADFTDVPLHSGADSVVIRCQVGSGRSGRKSATLSKMAPGSRRA